MNEIWMSQAMIYFHKCTDSGKFPKELNYIRLNLGIIKPYTNEYKKLSIL